MQSVAIVWNLKGPTMKPGQWTWGPRNLFKDVSNTVKYFNILGHPV